MKKIITTLILLFAGISFAMAMPGNRSLLRLRLSNGGQIVVNIDGRSYDKHGPSITVGDLPAGRHRIKVYEYRPYRDSRGGRAELVYSTVIRVRPNSFAYGVVDVNGGSLRLFNRDLDDYYAHRGDYDRDDYNGGDRPNNDNGYTDNGNNNNGYNGNNNGYNDNTPGGSGNNNGYNDNNGNYNDDRGGRDNGGYNNRNMMSGRDVEDLRSRVNDRITDTDKEKLMQSVLESRSCNTDQVRTMMSWLSFESTKLDFAKWAYDRVADNRNYWKLESEFSFSSSKDEFNDYIKGK